MSKGIEVAAASMFLLASMSIASCSGHQVQVGPVPKIETSPSVTTIMEETTPTSTKTQEPTLAPTETKEPTNTPTPTDEPTRIPSSKDSSVSGYEIYHTFTSPEWQNPRSIFVVRNTELLNYSVEGDEIVFEAIFNLYNLEIPVTLRSKGFTFMKVNFAKGIWFDQTEVNFETDLSSLLVEGEIYIFTLVAKKYPVISYSLIDDYIDGMIELELSLVGIEKEIQ